MELVFTGQDGSVDKRLLYDFKTPGIAMGMYNTDESIRAFAHSSFQVRSKKSIAMSSRCTFIARMITIVYLYRLLCKKNGRYTCLQRTQFSRNMTVVSRISLKKYTRGQYQNKKESQNRSTICKFLMTSQLHLKDWDLQPIKCFVSLSYDNAP